MCERQKPRPNFNHPGRLEVDDWLLDLGWDIPPSLLFQARAVTYTLGPGLLQEVARVDGELLMLGHNLLKPPLKIIRVQQALVGPCYGWVDFGHSHGKRWRHLLDPATDDVTPMHPASDQVCAALMWWELRTGGLTRHDRGEKLH